MPTLRALTQPRARLELVVTVEPGLYFAQRLTDVPERLRGIGVRIEDDVVVTDGEPEVMTAAIPKTVAEVEAAWAARRGATAAS